MSDLMPAARGPSPHAKTVELGFLGSGHLVSCPSKNFSDGSFFNVILISIWDVIFVNFLIKNRTQLGI